MSKKEHYSLEHRLTVASEWFNLTPLARRRCASRPSCEMTSLSSWREVVSVCSTGNHHSGHTHLLGAQLHSGSPTQRPKVTQRSKSTNCTDTTTRCTQPTICSPGLALLGHCGVQAAMTHADKSWRGRRERMPCHAPFIPHHVSLQLCVPELGQSQCQDDRHARL